MAKQATPAAWAGLDKPLTANVNDSEPLVVDLFSSYRSPYAYFVMDRMAELSMHYNVKVNVRMVYPIAVKNQQFFQDAPAYRYLYDPMDMARVAKFHGIPYAFPQPDLVNQDFDSLVVSEVYPHTYRLLHSSAAAQQADKAFQFAQRMFRHIYAGQTENWPDCIAEALTESGLDGAAVERDVADNPDKYEEIIQQNERDLLASGHGGVPNMVFRGEPFWGQDRFEYLVWRLKQNGLTRRFPLVD
jgi:2-hydroxychromene-2-carboxylate isomerase